MAQRGHENTIGILRGHNHACNLLRVAQAGVAPGFSAVGGFVNAVAHRQIRALQTLAAAGVKNIGIRNGDGDIADGTRGLIVKNWNPGPTGISRVPYASVVHADVKQIRPAGNAGGADRAPGAKRSDAAPAHALIKWRVNGLSPPRRDPSEREQNDPDSLSPAPREVKY